MMKLFISILISMSCFTASASTVRGLKEIADDLNYSLGVEWDQKDQVFYARAIEHFNSGFKELVDYGLTLDDVREFARQEVKDQKILAELEVALSAIQFQQANSLEIANRFQAIAQAIYSRGASWTGDRVAPYLVLGAIVFCLAVFAGPSRR